MNLRAQRYSIVVVDIESSGNGPDLVPRQARDRLRAVVEAAFDEAGTDHRAGPPPVDWRGGTFWLLPGVAPKADLTGRFIDFLQAGLSGDAGTGDTADGSRLRVAFHFGEAVRDGRGWAGPGLDVACRLVAVPALRNAFRAGPGSGLAVVASDDWHRAVLWHDHAGMAAETYWPVPVPRGDARNAIAWIRVPGYDAPLGLDLRARTGGEIRSP